MNYFTINNKRYKAPAFDFNTVCYFDEMGISLYDAKSKPTALIRAYFAILFDGDKEAAGRELEQHLINGGSLEDMTNAMIKEMNESRFFQAIAKNPAEEEAAAAKTTSKKK